MISPAERRLRHRESERARRARAKAKRRCIHCMGKLGAFDGVRCPPCADYHRDYGRSVYAERRDAGLCVLCGREEPIGGKVKGLNCMTKGAA